MIFSIEQKTKIDKIINAIVENDNNNIQNNENNKIQWILQEPSEIKYLGSRYEGLTICLGHGKSNKHIDNLQDFEEVYNFYNRNNQLNYFINVFIANADTGELRVVVYKCNNGRLDYSQKLLAETIDFDTQQIQVV